MRAQTTAGLTNSTPDGDRVVLARSRTPWSCQLLFELIDRVAGKTLLDVGCGDGELAFEMVRRGGIVTGLDADRAMIAATRRRAELTPTPIQLIEGQVENLPFEEGTFDCVVAVTVLCFVRDAKRAIAEMARVLKPDGQLVIGELGFWSLWAAYRRLRGWLGNPTWQAAMFRTAKELRDFVRAAELTEVEIRGAVHYPPWRFAAELLAPIDLWIGRQTTFGAAFVAISATKPVQVAGDVHH